MKHRETGTFIAVWLGLMALLALTVGSSFVPLGPWNAVINIAIAVAKAALVAWFFMGLRRSSALIRLAAGSGLFTLAVMFGLSATDLLARTIYWAPWQTPQQLAPNKGR